MLTVRASGVSRENRYIQSASLNGRPFTKSWLSHEGFSAAMRP
ncbi:MAG: glycoside hydrolase domain-containing protein [Alistipes sp.]